ncbi:ER membrane protein complex subunit 2 [Strongyloides ratti]|uniref:ER membrane protein complex subunit 2 n=1 Tax=Strongyloides ratti TaxID=34506 RepID=A0A090LBN2_STRRB|nr:ER membrane protein complex subunit 2 [Strongyloides ratti]CEF67171.1 ER membrane protein complex subunit 2 [Strongyloides ratti]
MAQQNTEDYTCIDFYNARGLLRKWRTDQVRNSGPIIEMWEHVLSRAPSSLGDELWPILEQVCISAMDVARHDIVLDTIQRLDKKFPNSNRVRRLQAMRLESLGKFSEATYLYDNLIKADPTKGDKTEAINTLNEHLKTYINDTEAWKQLSELYFSENDLLRGIHCLEELMLSNPHNPIYFRRLGEARYTLGGQENYEMAKKYFEYALEANPNCLRSSVGLMLVCNQLIQCKSLSASKKNDTVNKYEDVLKNTISIIEDAEAGSEGLDHEWIIRELECHRKMND